MGEWLNFEIGEVCEFSNGFAFKSSDYVEKSDDTIEVFRMGYIARGGGFKEDSTPVYVLKNYSRNIQNYYLRKDDVLIAMTDMKNNVAILANTARVQEDGRFVLNQRVGRFRVSRPNLLDPTFFYFYSNWQPHVDYLRSRANSGVQVNLSTSAIKEAKITIPPLKVQWDIASTLGALDNKIELNRQTNETLEAMARAIFKDWFVDFGPTRAKMVGTKPYLAPEIWSLFPEHLNDEGKPKGWTDGSLSDFTELQNGFAFKSSDWQENGVPVVKIGSVKPAVVDLTQISFISEVLAEERSNFRLNVGDVLVGLTGYVGETGRIPPTDNPPLLNQRVGRFSTSGRFSPFVYSCVRDPAFKEFAEGMGHGSAQANVSTKDLLSYPVLRPSKEILCAYESVVGPFYEMSLSNLGQMNTLASTRDLLLPKLMSGEIRVRDAKSTPEAVTAIAS